MLKVTPWIASVDLPVSSKVRFSVSPSSRLMPLNEESCEVVSICCRMLLYWVISPARVACAFGSATGASPSVPLKAWPATVAVPVIAPIVDEAALLLVVRVMTPVGSMVACRLLLASALLSWFSDDTWPAPVPKVMLVAVPPPVAPISNVLPVSVCDVPVAAWVTPPVRPSAVNAAESLEEMVRLALLVPVWSMIAPPLIDEAVPLPVAVSIAASRLATVPPVEIWLAPAVPVTKVSVLPSTVSVSPAVKPALSAPTEDELVPDSSVVPTSARGGWWRRRCGPR